MIEKAEFVATDGASNQQEVYYLGKPCLALRDYTLDDFQSYFRDVKHTLSSFTMPRAFYTKDIGSVHIINSHGVDCSYEQASHDFSYQLVDGTIANWYSHDGVQPLLLKDIERDNTLFTSMFHPRIPVTQNIPVLFTPHVLASLFQKVLGFSVDGENLVKGKSLWSQKEGCPVMHDSLTIVDDGVKKDAYATKSYDSEGVPQQKTVLVKKGEFVSGMYNTYIGNQAGVTSTGNCVRYPGNILGRDFTNLCVLPGKESYAHILSSVKQGILIHDVLGLHTMNVTTGDFSVGVLAGHMIDNGSQAYAIKDTMIAGNFYEMMQHVSAVSKDVQYANSGNYMPYILCDMVKVIGK